MAELQSHLDSTGFEGWAGIAHTLWATHGLPVTRNAHLINHLYDGDPLRTVQKAVKRLTGSFAIAVISQSEPRRVVGARRGCPLVVGVGDGEDFLASDAMALAGTTDQIICLEEGDVVDLRESTLQVYDRHDAPVPRKAHTVQASSVAVELAPYRHFMQKEIFEQPRALADTLAGCEGLDPTLFGAGAANIFKQIDAIQILACGTSCYAGMTAKYWLEALTGTPVSVEVASEYRHRKPAVNPNALVLVISQSGETADTLAALKYAHELGHRHSLAICNVANSAMVRETVLAYLTRAGVVIAPNDAMIGKLNRRSVTSQNEAKAIRQRARIGLCVEWLLEVSLR